MPGCEFGADPDPAHAGEAIIIQMAAIGADFVEFLSGWWPAMAATTVLAQMPVTRICETNAADPGPLTTDMVVADLATGLIPNINSPQQTLGWWIWNKALYAVFSRYCICRQSNLPPTPPIVWSPPTGIQPYPPGNENAPQFNRIENNTQVLGDGLTTLYNGIQLAQADTRDLAFRYRPSPVSMGFTNTFQMQGEGVADMWPPQSQLGDQARDEFGIIVRLDQIPPTVRRRGTTYQRLYGVGSVEWNAQYPPGTPHLITQRDSIHYALQFIEAPRSTYSWQVRWRLQPGVVATAWQAIRDSGPAFYHPREAADSTWVKFSGVSVPSGWQDPPFYPAATTPATPELDAPPV